MSECKCTVCPLVSSFEGHNLQCVCIYECVCSCVCVFSCVFARACVCVSVCNYACVCLCICACVSLCVFMSVCLSVCIYACVYAYVCTRLSTSVSRGQEEAVIQAVFFCMQLIRSDTSTMETCPNCTQISEVCITEYVSVLETLNQVKTDDRHLF